MSCHGTTWKSSRKYVIAIGRGRGTGRLPPSLARREAARRSRTLSLARRLRAGFNDGRSRHASTRLIRTSRITRHEVDAETSRRAPSGILRSACSQVGWRPAPRLRLATPAGQSDCRTNEWCGSATVHTPDEGTSGGDRVELA